MPENAPGLGIDWSNVSYTLTTNVEALIFTGSADISIIGNRSGNFLIGDARSNLLTGAGNDLCEVDCNGDAVVGIADGGYNGVCPSITTPWPIKPKRWS